MNIISTIASALLMFAMLMVGSTDAFGELTQDREVPDEELSSPRIVVDSPPPGEELSSPRIVVDDEGEALDDDSEAPDDDSEEPDDAD